ncbi:MAG: hypothetical protein SFZ02_21350 [bacterium]|nr:hypothetical protein [bacterium]
MNDIHRLINPMDWIRCNKTLLMPVYTDGYFKPASIFVGNNTPQEDRVDNLGKWATLLITQSSIFREIVISIVADNRQQKYTDVQDGE